MVRELSHAVFWQVIRAFLIAALLVVAELWASQLWADVRSLRNALIPPEALYTSFLSTAVQIVGVFLGLYFTAVSVLASTTYKDVPKSLRDLAIRDKVGNFYVGLSALTGALGLILLGIAALNWPISVFTFLLMMVLSVFGVYSFAVLGWRALEFFDPSVLSGLLSRQVLDAAIAATPDGVHWGDPSFQAHYQRKAEDALETYRSMLASVTVSERLTRAPYVKIAEHILGMYRRYAVIKLRIPLDSRWFSRITVFQSWWRASSTEVEMALRTGATLQPKESVDLYWLEAHLEALLSDVIGSLNKRGFSTAAVEVGTHVGHSIERLAETFQYEEALRLHRAVFPIAQAQARQSENGSLSPEALLKRLAIVEVFSNGGVGLLLGIGRCARTLDADQIRGITQEALGHGPEAPIGHAVPATVQTRLASMRKAIAFEKAAETERITPTWFTDHMVAEEYARFLRECVTSLLEVQRTTYVVESRELLVGGYHNAALLSIQKGIEACDKMPIHLGLISGALQNIAALQWKNSETEWPHLDRDDIEKRLQEMRDTIVVMLAQLAPELPTGPPTAKLPDNSGFAYAFLAQECYSALARRDYNLFSQIFPSFFAVAIPTDLRLRQELADLRFEIRATLIADLIEDLHALSGYALLHSSMHGGSSWQTVKEVWDKYLAALPDPKANINYMLRMMSYRRTAFMMSPRDLVRASWSQSFEKDLRERGVMPDRYGRRSVASKAAEQLPPLVRAFVAGGGFYEPEDTFAVEYLLKRPEAVGLTVPSEVRRFRDQLQSESDAAETGDTKEDDLD